MSGYAGMAHQQIYAAVITGQPELVGQLADALSDHGRSISSVSSMLTSSIASLKESWQGDVADRYIADIQRVADYFDHLSTVLSTSGSSYAQALKQASSDLSKAQTPKALPPPTADAPQAAWDKYINSGGGSDALDPKRAAAYARAQSAYQAQESTDHARCVQTITKLAADYSTAAAKMQPVHPAPKMKGSGSTSSAPTGGSTASAPTSGRSITAPRADGLEGSGGAAYMWQPGDSTGSGHHTVTDPGTLGSGTGSHAGVIGGQPVTTAGGLEPAAYSGGAIGIDPVSAGGGGGLSGAEIAGIAALGGAGVIGAIARNSMSAAAARAALNAEEQQMEAAALARNRQSLLSEEQAETQALSSSRARGTIMSAEEAALARRNSMAGPGGTAAQAGRGAMRPGRGVIGGEGENAERTTWLEEDRDVWGVGEHVAPVVGQQKRAPEDDGPTEPTPTD